MDASYDVAWKTLVHIRLLGKPDVHDVQNAWVICAPRGACGVYSIRTEVFVRDPNPEEVAVNPTDWNL